MDPTTAQREGEGGPNPWTPPAREKRLCTQPFLKIITILWKCTMLPKKRDFVAEAIGNMTIKNVVTDVCNCALHPLDLYCAGCRVKIVIQKVFHLWRLFPVEILGHFTPEAGRLVHRPRVHGMILFHARAMSMASDILGWTKNAIADGFGRRIYVRHFRI